MSRRAILALAVVLAIKAVVLWQLGGHPLLAPTGELDGAYYRHFAERVAHGDPWLLDAASFFGRRPAPFFISPLYIYFLAFCLKLFGSLDAARVVQIVLGTTAVGLLALTAQRWYGSRAGWWTGALATFCGLFTFHEIVILQAALDPFLTALDLFLLTRATQRFGWRRWGAAGVALGLHALNRPNVVIVLVGLALGMVVVRRPGLLNVRRATLLGSPADQATLRGSPYVLSAVFVLSAFLVISPATIRNWHASGEFVLISSHGGLNFLIGNGPQADGTFTEVMNVRPSVTGQWLGASDVVRAAIGHEPTSSEVSRFFFRQSFEWIRANPAAELGVLARKTWYTLSGTFLTLNHSYPFFAYDLRTVLAALFVGPVVLLPLAVVGLTLARPQLLPGFWIWAHYILLSIVSVVVFFVSARYRLPLQTALTVPAGGAAAWLAALIAQRAWMPVARAGALAVIPVAIAIWPTRLDDGRAEEQVGQALLDIQAGRTIEGEAWLNRALPHHAAPGVVHARAGQVYEAINRTDDAIAHYRQAVVIDPDEPSPHFALGRALFGARQDAEALAELARAIPGPQAETAKRIQVLGLSRLGRRDEADRLMASLDPRRWDVDQARGFAAALADLGRVDLSVVARRRAAEASGAGRDFEELGLAFARLSRNADAEAAFAEAVKRAPNLASAHLNHGVALAALGRLEEARREADAALALDPRYDRAKQFLLALPK